MHWRLIHCFPAIPFSIIFHICLLVTPPPTPDGFAAAQPACSAASGAVGGDAARSLRVAGSVRGRTALAPTQGVFQAGHRHGHDHDSAVPRGFAPLSQQAALAARASAKAPVGTRGWSQQALGTGIAAPTLFRGPTRGTVWHLPHIGIRIGILLLLAAVIPRPHSGRDDRYRDMVVVAPLPR